MGCLEDRVSIITGAATGIGRAIALQFAREGAAVVAADVNEEGLAALVAEIESDGGQARGVPTDVREVAQIDALVKATVDAHGRLDSIVNNAGVTRRAYIMDITEADWDRMHAVNARGVFFCLQSAARAMIERREGRIINIASIAGRGYEGTSNAAYAASKGAVISLTRTAAQQLGRHNINVNAICPGVTRTPLLNDILAIRAEQRGISPAEAEAEAAAPIPLKRVNEPEDIAAMAVFLASPGARNITGQAYNVDGGLITS